MNARTVYRALGMCAVLLVSATAIARETANRPATSSDKKTSGGT